MADLYMVRSFHIMYTFYHREYVIREQRHHITAIFCSCISFFLTFWLILRIGAIRTAYGDFIIPGVTLILSYLFVGESLTIVKVIGLAFVILGVVLVQIP